MNFMQELLEITISRGSDLQINSMAFPVGSRASLPSAQYSHLLHLFSHLHFLLLFSDVGNCSLPRVLLHNGHLEKIHAWDNNSPVVLYHKKPRLEIPMIHETGTAQWCLLLHAIILGTPDFTFCLWSSSASVCYFLLELIFQLLNPRCLSFFSWHQGSASGNHHHLAMASWVSGGRFSDPGFYY